MWWEDRLMAIPRRFSPAGARPYWSGCLVVKRGAPALYACRCKHSNPEDARDCAETVLHTDRDTPVWEQLRVDAAKHGYVS